MARPLLILAALLVVSGCASSSKTNDSAAAAAALRTVAEFRSSSYRIAPSDLLSVTVYPDARLNRKARVEADGAFSLPLVGTAPVAGLTVAEAQRSLEDRLAAYLVSPQVTLVVEEYGNRQMFVLGEVQNPGSYPVPATSRLTALQAVSAAGGFTKVAAPKRARILRYVEGKPVERTVNLKEAGEDVVLEPNDVVYVPQSVF